MGALLVLAMALWAGHGGSAGAAEPLGSCPNEAVRAKQGNAALQLPDCMALEMVSPPKKGVQYAKYPRVSADGSRVAFRSPAALANTTGSLDPFGDLYVATRTGSGWVTAPTAPPAGITKGWSNGLFGPAVGSFTPDFSQWFHVGATRDEEQLGIATVYRGALGGAFWPVSPQLVPVDGGSHGELNTQLIRLHGAAADHSRFYFRPGDKNTAYLSGDPSPSGSGDWNVYVAMLDAVGNPSLQLVARDKDGKVWGGRCGARIGSVGESVGEQRNQGAVSYPGGRRVIFSTRPTQPDGAACDPSSNNLRMLERVEDDEGLVTISPLFAEPSGECDRPATPDPPGPCTVIAGDDVFQGASVDGTKVYFVTPRQLADTDVDATQDLYLHDSTLPPGERLEQVSAGDASDTTPGAGAEVLNGVTAISTDGSHVYFVAKGVLTTDENDQEVGAIPGSPNLYVYRDGDPGGSLGFVGTLAAGDQGGLWASNGTFLNRAYPVPARDGDLGGGETGGDGHILVFQSHAQLTADDADGTGLDVFRFDATADALERVSKAGAGGSDNGAFDVEPRGSDRAAGTDIVEMSRWVNEDASSILFKTEEPLLPGAVAGRAASHLWRDEAVYRLPGAPFSPGNDSKGTEPVMSADGSTLAFPTYSALLPTDGDTAADVYAAQVAGGFVEPEPPVPCQPNGEGACQGPAVSPGFPGPTSTSVVGRTGNVKPNPRRCPKGKRKVYRNGRARCVKRRNHKRVTRKRSHGKRRVNGNQGGSK
ncbi:MAG TPA: hypothetical protein VFY04_11380 [Solirubrobacterales bacterium]|nr:hypothetical protein [Solirubrobacterales bacterium]